MCNFRFLCPVGKGGFDIECIDGTTIVFDCGSTPKTNVNNWIQHYKHMFERHDIQTDIDYVFISHFDLDHVNGLEELSKNFKIHNIVVPYIPRRYRVIYNFVSDFAVTKFNNILTNNFSNTKLLGLKYQTKYQSIKSVNKKWEWIFKSLFSSSQWETLRRTLQGEGIFDDNITYDDDNFFLNEEDKKSNVKSWEQEIESAKSCWNNNKESNDQIIEPESFSIDKFDIESYEINLSDEKIKKINDAIGEFVHSGKQKACAKNENGLMMLSKKCENTNIRNVHTFSNPYRYPFINNFCFNDVCSACLYTGDMRFDLKSCPTILDFLKMTNEELLLFQIPHHGSSHNTNISDLIPIPTRYFFLHDNDYKRIKKIITPRSLPLNKPIIVIDTVLGFFCEILIS